MTPKTKAIMGVHWGGYPIDLDKLRDIRTSFRSKFGWAPAVIEDGAQSFGAKQNNKHSCALSYIGTTSFFPSKPLGGYGDGGAYIIWSAVPDE